jgi:rhodanese-related sulfurtransferase
MSCLPGNKKLRFFCSDSRNNIICLIVLNRYILNIKLVKNKGTGELMKKLLLVVLVLTAILVNAQNQVINRLTAEEFYNKTLQAKEDESNIVLIDIRTKPEFEAGHIEGALMIDFYANKYIDNLKELDRTKTYIIYCRSGNRTGQTLQVMQQLGFENTSDLHHGIKSWVAAGYTLVK